MNYLKPHYPPSHLTFLIIFLYKKQLVSIKAEALQNYSSLATLTFSSAIKSQATLMKMRALESALHTDCVSIRLPRHLPPFSMGNCNWRHSAVMLPCNTDNHKKQHSGRFTQLCRFFLTFSAAKRMLFGSSGE